MKTIEIRCDNCKADITKTDEMPRFRLVLASESLPHDSQIVYSVWAHPEIKGVHHFCGKGCLKTWLNKEQE